MNEPNGADPCALCGADDDGFFPISRHIVRIDVSTVSGADLQRPFESFPARSLVSFDAVVCADCACIADDTAAAFRDLRRRRAPMPRARALASVWDRCRRAASILFGGA